MVTILQNVLVFILFYSFSDQYSDSRDMTVTTSLVIGAIRSQNDVKKFKWDPAKGTFFAVQDNVSLFVCVGCLGKVI